MAKTLPIHELEFLRISANHREFARKVATLGFQGADIDAFAKQVCEAWFRLGEAHLSEARALIKAAVPRATLSRAYYAAYNASKAARYLVQGFVSLKGDDHGKASTELPSDFPDVANWARRMTTLYENRLRADYDNWSNTTSQFSLTPDAAIREAEDFIQEVRGYLNTKYGMQL